MGLYDRQYGREYGEETPWDRHQRMQDTGPRSMAIMLMIITCVVFFVGFLSATTDENGDKVNLLNKWFACRRDTLIQPWTWFQFLTYGFLHDARDIWHLVFNMIGLFFFGRAIEQRLGRHEFLRFYLVAILVGGIVGSLTYLTMGVNGSVVGASGGVVATVILFAFYYPHQEILLMLVIPVKAWIAAVLFVVGDVLGAVGVMGAGTAFTVHLAGAGFAALYFKKQWSLAWLDFSGIANLRQNMAQRSRRMKLKIHDPDKKIEQEAAEADRILAKINDEGMDSLTASEKKILERYSRRQRAKRDT